MDTFKTNKNFNFTQPNYDNLDVEKVNIVKKIEIKEKEPVNVEEVNFDELFNNSIETNNQLVNSNNNDWSPNDLVEILDSNN